MLEKFAPTYEEDDIQYILRMLYKTNNPEAVKRANDIVEKYITYGIDFPARVREEFK
jgi:hypothetical protein